MSGRFERCFQNVRVKCPYDMASPAVYHQAYFDFLPMETLESFLAAGFRRNGNYLYTMRCQNCQACIPIRLEAETFKKNRNQRRVWRRNQDLEIKISPLRINTEKLNLCDKFLSSRFPGRGNTALEYYAGFFINSFGYTYEVEFRLNDQLIGLSIVDVYENAVNLVYFCFDPAAAHRSPGTFNILYMADYARRHGMKYIYLGLYIEEVAAMNYKLNFKPCYLLQENKWILCKRP
ncbi:MAG TPA: arginyltransferase [Desulfobacterales bacterium]|nr:arginyltransferase [Desulfobacterales bacterium]